MFPYPEPTDDQQETLQMMVDPVERFFAEKGTCVQTCFSDIVSLKTTVVNNLVVGSLCY